MIVLDASAAIELVTGTDLGRGVAARIADPTETLHAPHLLSVEVGQVLRRLAREGRLSPTLATAAVEHLLALDISRYPHELLLPRAWQLRETVTAYDGMYLALAEALSAPLLTFDRRLQRASGHHAEIEVPDL